MGIKALLPGVLQIIASILSNLAILRFLQCEQLQLQGADLITNEKTNKN